MTRQEKIQEAKFDVNYVGREIVERAEKIKSDIEKIQKELEQVYQRADYIIENSEDAGHFQVDPWNLTAWRDLPAECVKLDTKIKAYGELKRLMALLVE